MELTTVKGHMGLFPDIFSVKEAIGENNYVTIYNHLCHCLLFLSNLYFESYSSFVWSTGGIFDSWCKGKKGTNRVIEGMGCRADSQVKESQLGTCRVSLLFRLACVGIVVATLRLSTTQVFQSFVIHRGSTLCPPTKKGI